MRIGLIGAGRIGTLHAGVLRAIDAVDELVIVDVEADRAKSLAETLGVSHLDRPHDVFDKVDAVVIASSTETHSPTSSKPLRPMSRRFARSPSRSTWNLRIEPPLRFRRAVSRVGATG